MGTAPRQPAPWALRPRHQAAAPPGSVPVRLVETAVLLGAMVHFAAPRLGMVVF